MQLGKADTVSHKFRRKSKVKEAKSGETTSTHNMTCSSFSSLSNVAYEDDYYLNTLHDRGDKELKTFSLSSELLDSESLTELPLVEKFSNCSLSTPSLFADNSMEIFHPPQSTAASVAKENSLASSFLEETTEYIHSNAMEICNNETISVSSYKIWKDDCLLMVWSVTNKSGLELKSANLEIFPAENFKVKFKGIIVLFSVCILCSLFLRSLNVSFTFVINTKTKFSNYLAKWKIKE